MHGVDFGKMTAEGASRTHLDASDWLHGAGRLRQRRVASGLAAVLYEWSRYFSKTPLQKDDYPAFMAA